MRDDITVLFHHSWLRICLGKVSCLHQRGTGGWESICMSLTRNGVNLKMRGKNIYNAFIETS